MTKALSLFLTGVTLFVATCYAQSALPSLVPLPSPTLNNTIMNLTFSDPRASNCGRSSTAQNESVTIVIRTGPIYGACLDLDFIFTHPNETYAPGPSNAPQSDPFVGLRYTLTSPTGSDSVGWSPSTYNYSQVFYTQSQPDPQKPEDKSAVGYMMVRAFEDAGCPGEGSNMTASTWYSWNCQDVEGQCNTLPFSVKSLWFTGPDRGKGCVKAVKYDGGSNRGVGVSAAAILVVGLGIASAMML